MAIEYSDGPEIEREILEILDGATELGSARSIAPERHGAWPLRYHLCAERANLLRHLSFAGLDVLELGAGMGAVSRFLAEQCRFLTVVEGAPARYRALRSRLRDLYNWNGVVANAIDVRLEGTFDVVCVIGVLEYAELYVPAGPGESPFEKLLATAIRHLSPEGVLVLAIENKLGLKYWSGAPEDHVNTPFAGVCGYPRAPSPRTFSRRELLRLLETAGVATVDEFFPFPDYKVPESVISAEFVRLDAELAANVATAGALDNRSGPRLRLFPEQLAAKTLARAGLLAELANSFLLVAARTRESAVRRRVVARSLGGEVGWHYSPFRRIPTATTFLASSSGHLEVEKSRLDGRRDGERFVSTRHGTTILWHPISRRPVTAGTLLRDRLLQDAYFERWPEFNTALLRFLNWVVATFSLPGAPGELTGSSLDAIYTNAALGADDEFLLFDLEWELGSPMLTSWFVLRNVAMIAKDFEALTPAVGAGSLAELYANLCRALGVLPALADDLAREADLRSLVVDVEYRRHLEALTYDFERPFGPRGFPRDGDAELVPRSVARDYDAAARSASDAKAVRERVAELERELGAARERDAITRSRLDELEREVADYRKRDAASRAQLNQLEHELARHRLREQLLTHRLAAKAEAFVLARPWARRLATFAVTSAVRIRDGLTRRPPA